MDKRLQSVFWTLVATLAVFLLLVYVGGTCWGLKDCRPARTRCCALSL